MEGAAEQWYYHLEQNRGVPTWPQFVDLVNKRFGPPVRSNPFGELTHLRRTGTVREYEDQFLQLLVWCERLQAPADRHLHRRPVQPPAHQR